MVANLGNAQKKITFFHGCLPLVGLRGGAGVVCKRAPAKCMGRGQKMVRAADKQNADKQTNKTKDPSS